MNFVIFPMFFVSSALYPLWKVQESGAEVVYQVARVNPFTHAVELIRFALYGQFNRDGGRRGRGVLPESASRSRCWATTRSAA